MKIIYETKKYDETAKSLFKELKSIAAVKKIMESIHNVKITRNELKRFLKSNGFEVEEYKKNLNNKTHE